MNCQRQNYQGKHLTNLYFKSPRDAERKKVKIVASKRPPAQGQTVSRKPMVRRSLKGLKIINRKNFPSFSLVSIDSHQVFVNCNTLIYLVFNVYTWLLIIFVRLLFCFN